MNEYPPEVQAVLDAAVAYAEPAWVSRDDSSLVEAIDAYRKSIAPPEPFEVDMLIYSDGSKRIRIPQGDRPALELAQVWRVTVTPIERVR